MELTRRAKSYEWDDLKDEIVLTAVRENPKNRNAALRTASSILEVDYHICRNRWYGVLKKRYDQESNNVQGQLPRKSTITEVKEAVDEFLGVVQSLHKQNLQMQRVIKNQEARLEEQSRIMRDMAHDRKELEESYVYILKVMEKARKMFVEEEGETKAYTTDSSGSVSFK